MKKKIKKIPHFKSEDDERKYWSSSDATEHFNISSGKKINFPNLRPSTQALPISDKDLSSQKVK